MSARTEHSLSSFRDTIITENKTHLFYETKKAALGNPAFVWLRRSSELSFHDVPIETFF